MNFKMTLMPRAKLAKRLKEIDKRTRDGFIAGLDKSATAIHREIVRSMEKTKRQKITRGSRGHRPSEPGYPPAIDTARLVSSIQVEVNEKKLTVEIGTNEKRGAWLEFGTRDGRIAARPWLRPAAKKVTKNIKRFFKFKFPKKAK